MLYFVLARVLLHGLYGIGRLDAEWEPKLERQDGLVVGIGIPIALLIITPGDCVREELCLVVLAVCLFAACIMDLQNQSIYNFVWLPALTGGILLCLSGGTEGEWEPLISAIAYCLLQEAFFSRWYGRADCHGFTVCSICMAGMGMELEWFLLHMTVTFLLLAVIQAFYHNIAANGNLKTPVPLLPYLTAGFWILYCLHCIFIQT